MVKRFSDGPIFEDPNLKCYMKCYLIISKMWNENGTVNLKTAMETLSLVSEADQLILMGMGRPCFKFNKVKDLCERAFLTQKCVKEKDPFVSVSLNL